MSLLRIGLPANYQPQRDSGLHREVNRQMAEFLREIRLRAGMSQEALGKRIARHQKFVSDSEKALRRISVCEFLEFCWGCDTDGAAAFTEFLSRTRFEVKPAKTTAPSANQSPSATTKKKITSKK